MSARQTIVIKTTTRSRTPKTSSSTSSKVKNTSGNRKGQNRCPTCGRYR